MLVNCAREFWSGFSAITCADTGFRNNKSIVDEVTTLRRHLEANHSVHDTSTVLCVALMFSLLGEVSQLGGEH